MKAHYARLFADASGKPCFLDLSVELISGFTVPPAEPLHTAPFLIPDGSTFWIGAPLSSDAKCNPPRRFDIGKVVQDLKECCHAILFASVGGRKRPDRRFAGRGAVDGGNCPDARSGESHHLPGAAAERTPFGRVLAASRRRSLSIAQAA